MATAATKPRRKRRKRSTAASMDGATRRKPGPKPGGRRRTKRVTPAKRRKIVAQSARVATAEGAFAEVKVAHDKAEERVNAEVEKLAALVR